MNLSLDIAGDATDFYADNVLYYQAIANNGYTGSVEIAKVPDQMLKEVFGFTETTSHVLQESADAEPKRVALLFQFEGDQSKECYALYNCLLKRPGYSGATISGTKEPATQSMDLTAAPSTDPTIFGKITGRTTTQTTTSVVNTWFTTVHTA